MIDRTAPLLLDGYMYLTRLRERAGRDTVPLRLLGRPATCLVGPEATKLFYDSTSFDRHGVVPPNVQKTLFGDAAVHLLDGAAHHQRKALFVNVLDTAGTHALTEAVCRSWDRAIPRWRGSSIVLFDEATRVLTEAVHEWAGIPLADSDVEHTAADMIAMVDGFASVGTRYVRAATARKRQERRIEELAADARNGHRPAPADTPFGMALEHRDEAGDLLDEHTVAVEMLNLLRPTVAVAWFVTYAAHALHHWPAERTRLARADTEAAMAFTHEVRRFYPFAPLLAARARQDLYFDGITIPSNTLGVLDVFGQNHHQDLWPDPWTFTSARHIERPPGMFDLVPQGGGDPVSGHRCPGEPATVEILTALAPRIMALDARLPEQDLSVTRHRIPARVTSGVALEVPPG
jgi:fatty-acid peroxygenase